MKALNLMVVPLLFLAGALLFYRPKQLNEVAIIFLVWVGVLVVTFTGFSLMRVFNQVGFTDLFVLILIFAVWPIPFKVEEIPILVAGFFGIGAGIFISGQIYGSPDDVLSPMDMPDEEVN